VSSVTVSPSSASVAKGGTKQFTATVSGIVGISQSVTWSLRSVSYYSSISSSGVLTVHIYEIASTLYVRATSTADSSKYSEVTVTVTSGGGG
jgi:hypothetical protein